MADRRRIVGDWKACGASDLAALICQVNWYDLYVYTYTPVMLDELVWFMYDDIDIIWYHDAFMCF